MPWLTDRKWAHIRLEGQSFGDVPLNVELKLEVWDSPNSAGIVIDAVRIIKLALNNGIAGQLDGPSSYLMKSPHTQRPDDEAREQTDEFIAKNARTAATKRTTERASAKTSKTSSCARGDAACSGGRCARTLNNSRHVLRSRSNLSSAATPRTFFSASASGRARCHIGGRCEGRLTGREAVVRVVTEGN